MPVDMGALILQKLEYLETDMAALKVEVAEMKIIQRRTRWIWGGAGAVVALAGKEVLQWAIAALLPVLFP